MKLRQNRFSCCDLIYSVTVIFVILISQFNYGLCNQIQEAGDNSDAESTANSAHNDIMLNDETFKFYDNVDELAANLFNDTVTEYPNDAEDIDEDNLKKLMENYDKTYTNETWIVEVKDSREIIEKIHNIVEEFKTEQRDEIIIVSQEEDNVGVSQMQHDDLHFGLEIVTGSSTEAEPENGFDVRNDVLVVQTTELGSPRFSTDHETLDVFRSDDFESQTTEIEEDENSSESVSTTKPSDFAGNETDLFELENDDLLIEEVDPVIVDLSKSAAPGPTYEDYTTEEEATTESPYIEELTSHKINPMPTPESTTPKIIPSPEVIPTTVETEFVETTPKPSILQTISTYMSGIFNFRYGDGEGRNFEINPYEFSTEIIDDFATTGYDTDRKRAEEQSIIEIEKILDPEVQNEFIKDIVVDKSPELQSVFQKPDESNILNRGLVDASTDTIDVEKFLFDKINRDNKTATEHDEELSIDNNLYANSIQNSRINHVPNESKSEDKIIIELEQIIDPGIQNEFIKDIVTSSDHTVEVPVIESVKVIDNTDGDTETHVTERSVEENGRHIHEENKVVSVENPDIHRVMHENVHIEQSNDTLTADQTKIEIETDDTQRVEVQDVTHKEDEKDLHTEKKSEHVTIDEPGFHMENHETIETTKTKHGDVIDTEDVITKDLDNVHVVEKVRIHEDNKMVYEKLMKKEDEIRKTKTKIDELKKEINILKEDIKRPNELIAYEAEVLKIKGFLPDKLELIADYLNFREHQLHGEEADKYGLKRYLQRLTKERELDNLKLKKDKLKKQLVVHFKAFLSAEQKFGIHLSDEIEKSVEKLDEISKSSSSISSKSPKIQSSEEDDASSEERTWNNFMKQARLAAEERVQRRDEEVKLLQCVLNVDADDVSEIRSDDTILPTFVFTTTPLPVLFPDIDKESQIILLETLVRLPTVETEKDLIRNFPLTTDLPITTIEPPITEEISIEIDEIEKIADEQSHTVKIIDKRILLHNGDDKNVEIDETVSTQNGDKQTEMEHTKRIEKIDEKTRSRIIEILMPKLHEKSINKQNVIRQAEARSQPDDKMLDDNGSSSVSEDDDVNNTDSMIRNEALRTVIEGVELTSEIARSIELFRTPVKKISEILAEGDKIVKTETHHELADEIGRAEEILGIEENKIVNEIAELELVGVNLALILFCILCAFLILIITIICFLRKSKHIGGLNFIPV